MKDLLYLVHRIPYPPNKGDKIASYHMLKFLTQRYRVHVGAFIDDPHDLQYVKTVEGMIQGESRFVSINPLQAKIKSLFGLLTGEPLSVRFYHDTAFQQWVDSVISRHSIRRAVIFSGAMAQFVAQHREDGMCRIVDFVDVDSDKWRQYALNQRWPMSWVYRRESRVLLDFEQEMSREMDFSAFVSPQEVELFQALTPDTADKTEALVNGVDWDYFNPEQTYLNPYPDNIETLVFTGAMDYWANVDAVIWFAETVFPRIKAERPNASFYIVGSRPTAKVQALASLPSVQVTGRVEDIRPYLAHANLVVAPLRIARGIQNKVLEAMAMGKPVLVTGLGMEGIKACVGQQGLVHDTPEGMATAAVASLASGKLDERGPVVRQFVLEHYDWERNLGRLETLLESASAS